MGAMKELWEDHGTIWFLDQFGLWVNQPAEINLGYPKKTNFALMQGRSIARIRIDDEVAGFIHDSINQLGERSQVHKDVLISFYIKRRTLEKAGEKSGLKRAKAIETLRSAEIWIDCKLNDFFRLTEAQRVVYKHLLDKAS